MLVLGRTKAKVSSYAGGMAEFYGLTDLLIRFGFSLKLFELWNYSTDG
jgi:hypothetical protein